jgi:hypothetical protein
MLVGKKQFIPIEMGPEMSINSSLCWIHILEREYLSFFQASCVLICLLKHLDQWPSVTHPHREVSILLLQHEVSEYKHTTHVSCKTASYEELCTAKC